MRRNTLRDADSRAGPPGCVLGGRRQDSRPPALGDLRSERGRGLRPARPGHIPGRRPRRSRAERRAVRESRRAAPRRRAGQRRRRAPRSRLPPGGRVLRPPDRPGGEISVALDLLSGAGPGAGGPAWAIGHLAGQRGGSGPVRAAPGQADRRNELADRGAVRRKPRRPRAGARSTADGAPRRHPGGAGTPVVRPVRTAAARALPGEERAGGQAPPAPYRGRPHPGVGLRPHAVARRLYAGRRDKRPAAAGGARSGRPRPCAGRRLPGRAVRSGGQGLVRGTGPGRQTWPAWSGETSWPG